MPHSCLYMFDNHLSSAHMNYPTNQRSADEAVVQSYAPGMSIYMYIFIYMYQIISISSPKVLLNDLTSLHDQWKPVERPDSQTKTNMNESKAS